MASSSRAVSLDTIQDAAAHIYDLVVRTPLVRLDVPSAWRARWPAAPRALYLKLETLQPVGSFKIRGAHNAIRQLAAGPLRTDERRDGVWTVSAGNAAQGVALAARQAGLPCTVLLPDSAPAAKRTAIARFGATIVTTSYERCWEAVERRQCDGMRGTLIHPFDDDRFISGNGTIGLEIAQDLSQVGGVVVALGGGGLIGGAACAIRALCPDARIYAAEPETAAPLAASLAAGEPLRFPAWTASFVDGAGARSVLPSMWPLLRDLDGSIVVSLADVQAAMRLVAEQVHVIAEGAAATAVAAALTGLAGSDTVVAILSGGNIDLTRFTTLVEHASAQPPPAAVAAASPSAPDTASNVAAPSAATSNTPTSSPATSNPATSNPAASNRAASNKADSNKADANRADANAVGPINELAPLHPLSPDVPGERGPGGEEFENTALRSQGSVSPRD